jgi:succinate-acetate transporter protein
MNINRFAERGRDPVVLPAAFFFGGLVQIIVAVLEISRGNLFGGRVRNVRPVPNRRRRDVRRRR